MIHSFYHFFPCPKPKRKAPKPFGFKAFLGAPGAIRTRGLQSRSLGIGRGGGLTGKGVREAGRKIDYRFDYVARIYSRF